VELRTTVLFCHGYTASDIDVQLIRSTKSLLVHHHCSWVMYVLVRSSASDYSLSWLLRYQVAFERKFSDVSWGSLCCIMHQHTTSQALLVNHTLWHCNVSCLLDTVYESVLISSQLAAAAVVMVVMAMCWQICIETTSAEVWGNLSAWCSSAWLCSWRASVLAWKHLSRQCFCCYVESRCQRLLTTGLKWRTIGRLSAF